MGAVASMGFRWAVIDLVVALGRIIVDTMRWRISSGASWRLDRSSDWRPLPPPFAASVTGTNRSIIEEEET